jgi:hypothetical protein
MHGVTKKASPGQEGIGNEVHRTDWNQRRSAECKKSGTSKNAHALTTHVQEKEFAVNALPATSGPGNFQDAAST